MLYEQIERTADELHVFPDELMQALSRYQKYREDIKEVFKNGVSEV